MATEPIATEPMATKMNRLDLPKADRDLHCLATKAVAVFPTAATTADADDADVTAAS